MTKSLDGIHIKCTAVCFFCVCGESEMKEGEETRRVLLLTWQVPLKFWEYCCIQLLLVARGFVAMATQPCAPAQGRSSSSEPSGAAHRMDMGGRGLFKVTNKKACGQLANSAPPPQHPGLLSPTRKQTEGSCGRGARRFICQLIKYLAGQWETQRSSGCGRRAAELGFVFPFMSCSEAT